jgi:hypothetical protein
MQRYFLIGILMIAMAIPAVAQQYEYYGTIIPSATQTSMGGVALKSDGNLYYVTFSTGSELMYVQNAVSGAPAKTYTIGSVATLPMAAGRGLNDIEVDSSGNVYVSGTGSAAADTQLVKYGPAPTHTQLWSMTSLGAADQIRHNGIELIGSDLVISEGFSTLTFKNPADGTNRGVSVTGGTTYQRSLAYNPSNDDIYAGKNGNYVSSILNVFSGGSPSNPSAYAQVLNNLLPDMGQNTQYGTGTQPIDFDAVNNQLIAADADDQAVTGDTTGVRIYDVAGSGASTTFTEAQYIPSAGNVLGISHAVVDEEDFIAFCAATSAIPDSSYVIELYNIPSGVGSWNQY